MSQPLEIQPPSKQSPDPPYSIMHFFNEHAFIVSHLLHAAKERCSLENWKSPGVGQK